MIRFKTVDPVVSARLGALPLDYEWDSVISNGFIAASDEDHPRLADAIEALNIHGAADLAIAAVEWCMARTQAHVPPQDGLWRLQSAWAATVDPHFSTLAGSELNRVAEDDLWTRPERRARGTLEELCEVLTRGRTAKVRQTALGAVLMAEHLCGRDPAFAPWLAGYLALKTGTCPREADDKDYTHVDTTLTSDSMLTAPDRAERLDGLSVSGNPYLGASGAVPAIAGAGQP
ncbi:hypothetical protein [Roseateles terrae]|uniref:Uncharacterized protein n=1 Tax=Roseateles terrae TaxID=431060 RepID=A0ABR6GXC5_9BURK|nr:hypothetical protein [Roseateles terrae]MBB3196755.1 hypothetical protein [Roseateles terrae]OWQ84990.1 hypothetical protein CDN98_18275 [Roseateles terrae]